MALLNTASDGLMNIFIVLFETISDARSGIGEAAILGRCEPPDAGSESKLRQTLRRWTELGLFVEKNNRLYISETYRTAKPTREVDSLSHVRYAARAAVLAPENNERFWAATNSKAADLTRSLAWLLAQDVYDVMWPDLADLEARQFKLTDEDLRTARNSNRLAGLRSWATFLGFMWEDQDRIAIDPTVAILEVINSVLLKEDEVPVTSFVETLARILPVLDTGSYRIEVEANLNEAQYRKPAADSLSTSLSRALYRLRREQVIEFKNRSDSKLSFSLMGPSSSSLFEKVTHVARGQAF
jgi:hypothetical protein